MGLLDGLPFWPAAGEPERVPRGPRLRRTRSWIGRQSDGTPFYRSRKKSTTDTTTDGMNSTGLASVEEEYASQNYVTVTSDGMVSEHYEKVPGQYPSASEARTANDVSFDSVRRPTGSRQSWGRARGLPGVFSLLRPRKVQRQGPSTEQSHSTESGPAGEIDEDHIEGADEDDGGAAKPAEPNPEVDAEADIRDTRQLDNVGDSVNEKPEERKVSDQTVLSRGSEGTNVTVYRHPSKRTSRPIAIVDREYVYENPFDDVRETSHAGIGHDPFSDPTRSTSHSARPSGSEYSDGPRAPGYLDRPGNPVVKHFPFDSRSSSQRSSFHVLSRGSDWSDLFDPHEAAFAFNELAAKLNLQQLTLSNDHHPSTGDECCAASMEDKSPRRRDRIFGRLRLMRSSLAMKVPKVPEERGLRRMKTFASFPSRAPQMVSLRGKPLVTLARLGGQSLLDLPADFAPATLKLPVCFVTTALYLRRNAPSVRNLFFDSGDPKAAARLYDRFAYHVLSAEKEGDKIEMTMRSSEMPLGFSGNIHLGTPARNTTDVLSVASVFRALLAGLPGGILGSRKLYGVLVDMYYARFADCQLERTNSCLGGLSVLDSIKTKAMAHAMLALTSKMQLELICGVFGLCAVLLHETERNIEFERQARRGNVGSGFVSGLMNVDRLGRVFGPLLVNKMGSETGAEVYGNIEREIESERVATMLIANWRNVSRQLRSWEQGGYPAKPVGHPVRSSGAKSMDES